MGDELLSCVFVNLKPGTGKTTCSVYLSAALHAAGRRVLQVDADPGGSALRWSDLAGGLPWSIVGLAKKTVYRDVTTLVARGDWDTVVIDSPQMEDHAAITHGAMTFCRRWIAPLAPAGIEVDRMAGVTDHMDQVDATLTVPGDRLVLLNRTNRRQPSATGPDAEVREIMAEQGFHVFAEQVNHNDSLYRQSFGTVPDPSGTPFASIAAELIDRHERVAAR
jgi:chromosome partitioning protein